MKILKINNENNCYVCEECNKNCKNLTSLTKHIVCKHMSKEQYFIKWLFEEGDNICKCEGCNNKTKFENFRTGYKNTCCEKCKNKYCQSQIKRSLLEKFNIVNISQLPKTQEKIKKTREEKILLNPNYYKEIAEKASETFIKNLGVSWPMQSTKIKEKGKETCLEKLGVDHPMKSKEFRNKICEKNFKKTGYREIFAIPEIRQKIKEILIEKLGVDNASKSNIIKDKVRKTCVEKGLWLDNDKIIIKNLKNYRIKVWRITLSQLNLYGKKYINFDKKTLNEINKSIKDKLDKFSVDHKYSIYEGFKNNIDPKIIGNIVNLEIIKLGDNFSKGRKCSITLEELLFNYFIFIKSL